MKFYGGVKNNGNNIWGILMSDNSKSKLRQKYEEEKAVYLYEDYLKLAAYFETTGKFDHIKTALKTLALKGNNDALAYYLFNANELDEEVRKQALVVEEHGDRKNPAVLKVIAGLHLHDKIDSSFGTKTAKELVDMMKKTESYIVAMSGYSDFMMQFLHQQIQNEKESLRNIEKVLGNSQYLSALRKAQLAYFDAYNNSKNPLDAREYMNLRFFSPACDKLDYKVGEDTKMSGSNLQALMFKTLNKSLKNSEVNGEYYLPFAYAYCSLVCKDQTKWGIHSKSILKSISKLPLKTENLKIESTRTKN